MVLYRKDKMGLYDMIVGTKVVDFKEIYLHLKVINEEIINKTLQKKQEKLRERFK